MGGRPNLRTTAKVRLRPINPDELSPALKKAAEAGVKIALISNMPSGFQQGKDYTGLVGDDLYAMGQKTADNLAKAMGGEGELGFLYFDANAYVVNQRDAAFRTTIEKNYPNIKIIPAGFSDPGRVFQVASAMILQHPKIKAIYAPWADPAVMAVVEVYLAGLEGDLRDVHEVRYVRGLPQREAAAQLGISRQQLRTREARLRDGLREALAKASLLEK